MATAVPATAAPPPAQPRTRAPEGAPSARPTPTSAAPAISSRVGAGAAPADTDASGLSGLAGSDFPTSILDTVQEPAQPLLAAFANRPALLAAIVFSEAFSPPVALR